MKIFIGLSTVAALALTASSAMAAPYVTGRYAYLTTSNCETQLTVIKNPTASNVASIENTKPGLMLGGIGYIVFTPSHPNSTAGTASVVGSQDIEGGAVRVTISGKSFGKAWGQTTHNVASASYSFTATTLTLGSSVYVMTYANLVSGVYHNLYLAERDTSDSHNANCVRTISMTRQ